MTRYRPRFFEASLACLLCTVLLPPGVPAAAAEEITVYYDYVENGELKGGVLRLDAKTAPSAFLATANPAPGPWAVTTIVNNGPSGNRIDLVIVGDGYTAADLPGYAADAVNVVNGFFAQEPLAAYATCFNVHRVDVVSNESGVDEPDFGIYRDTALDMSYNCSDIDRLLCVNVSKAQSAAAAAPQAEQILALANSTRYGGAGYPSADMATLAGKNASAIELALHEFGHAFADLADEYDYGGAATYAGPEPPPPNVSIYNAAQQLSLQTKWYRWLDLPTVDTFEGAMYSQYGIYRPTGDSRMRSLNRPFEEVNAEQLVLSIYRIISPVDAATPIAPAPLGSWYTFSVTPIQPAEHALSIQWSLDGVDVAGATQTTFRAPSFGLPAGPHTVAVRVLDNTTRVRDETARAARMTFTRQWPIIADCNTNGIADVVEILTRKSLDCDANWLPDACQADADGDTVPDVCDACPGFDDTLDSDADAVADGCDACPGTFPGARVDAHGCPDLIPCDSDGDEDVDQVDFGRFQVCLTGTNVPQPQPACAFARLDQDADVDAADFMLFQGCYSGPGVPADPSCADP